MATTETSEPSRHVALRSVATAAAFTVARPSLVRRWSRKTVQATPPPLPLISLPPDDDWEEFDVPVKTGFAYALPHVELDDEELRDESAARQPHHDRAAICRVLSEYMSQNEAFQVRRHGFGIDTALVYKRSKSSAAAKGRASEPQAAPGADDLAFDAFFESGNLDRAYRVLGRHYATTQELLSGAPSTSSSSSSSSSPWSSPFPFFAKADMEYDLYCDTDMSTHGHIQWYFFRVCVPPACFARAAGSTRVLRVRFNVRNMLKKASLYNDGMLPAVYLPGARGWHHAGVNVCYFKNADTYRNRKTGKAAHFYSLSFVYEFELPPEASEPVVAYFAHCYPYTYSRLQRFLLGLQKDPARRRVLRRRVLCKTIAGNICDVLTITDFDREDDAREGVVLTARVHPGESNASFLMHGLVDFLTGPSTEARFLRHRFVFKVVPMLNPDGVVHGNYRCSLAGTDLNRRYIDPSPELHPTVFATKQLVLSMSRTRPVSLYCDIHGHSRKRNMFLYGCVPFDEASRAEAARLRLFPHVLSKTSAAYSFRDCTFSVSKSKKGTGRVVVWSEARVLHSFTLEASFFGVGVNKKRLAGPATTTTNQQPSVPATPLDNCLTHFMPHDLRSAGASFGLALIPFSHLLDRDKPPAAVPMAPPVSLPRDDGLGVRGNDSVLRAFSAVHSPVSPTSSRPSTALGATGRSVEASRMSPRDPLDVAKAGRLAPLAFPSGPLAGSASTPFLAASSRPAMATLSVESSSPTISSSSLGQFCGMDAMLTSLPSTDDLLREIEDTLPENYAQCGDSDDEGESAGSESDPSGDNMEAEELQRQDSWKELVKDASVVGVTEPPPRLTKNRSQSLLKRFSDSMLRLQMPPDNIQPNALQADATPTTTGEPATPSRAATPAEELTRDKPAMTLAPVKAPSASTAYLVRRHAPVPASQSAASHPRDRNKDIASLHLRAVQRRSRAKRTSHRLVITEQELQ